LIGCFFEFAKSDLQGCIFIFKSFVAGFKVPNVFRRFGEDGSLVQLVRWCNTLCVIVIDDGSASFRGPKRRHTISKFSNLFVQIRSIALFDDIVRSFLGRDLLRITLYNTAGSGAIVVTSGLSLLPGTC
jgi:hypothetical protein